MFGLNRSVTVTAECLVTGLGYRPGAVEAAFGTCYSQTQDIEAKLIRGEPNEWNRTPVEVHVNSHHIGWLNDDVSPRVWPIVKRPVVCPGTVTFDATGAVSKVYVTT